MRERQRGVDGRAAVVDGLHQPYHVAAGYLANRARAPGGDQHVAHDALGLACAALTGDLAPEVIVGHVHESRLVLDTLGLPCAALIVGAPARLG